MTEYESAILALETAQGIRAQVALVQAQAELVGNGGLAAFTFISGYIIVAYYAAAKLSRSQVALFNLLYVLGMAFTMLSTYTAHAVGTLHYTKLLEIDPSRIPIPYWSQSTTMAHIAFLVVCTLVSLAFFYSFRLVNQDHSTN